MKYLFRRGGRVWHIVRSHHLANTTGVEMFCYERILVPDFYGDGYTEGLFRHRDVVQAIKAVPPIDSRTLERIAGSEADLFGPVCRTCVRLLRRQVLTGFPGRFDLGNMAEVLFPDIFGPMAENETALAV